MYDADWEGGGNTLCRDIRRPPIAVTNRCCYKFRSLEAGMILWGLVKKQRGNYVSKQILRIASRDTVTRASNAHLTPTNEPRQGTTNILFPPAGSTAQHMFDITVENLRTASVLHAYHEIVADADHNPPTAFPSCKLSTAKATAHPLFALCSIALSTS